MPDLPHNPNPDPGHAPDHARGWREAFAALPAETPPADGWSRLESALDAPSRRHRGRWALGQAMRPWRSSRLTWLATAATLLLALALPWRLLHAPMDPATSSERSAATPAPPGGDNPEATTAMPSMQALYTESAQLESLLIYARDDRVASGTAVALTDALETRIAAIDVALAQPGLDDGRERFLWQERVLALRALVSFESNRRWLAARGERYDGALVRVD